MCQSPLTPNVAPVMTKWPGPALVGVEVDRRDALLGQLGGDGQLLRPRRTGGRSRDRRGRRASRSGRRAPGRRSSPSAPGRSSRRSSTGRCSRRPTARSRRARRWRRSRRGRARPRPAACAAAAPARRLGRAARAERGAPARLTAPRATMPAEQRDLDQHRPAERGLDEVRERADLDDALHDPGREQAAIAIPASCEKRPTTAASSRVRSSASSARGGACAARTRAR